MSKLSLILVAAIASSGAALPASAQGQDRPQIAVRYDDLNLASASGRERLDTRVRTAIRDMCDTGTKRDLKMRAIAQECEMQAKRSIEPQMAALFHGSSARFASEKPAVVAAP